MVNLHLISVRQFHTLPLRNKWCAWDLPYAHIIRTEVLNQFVSKWRNHGVRMIGSEDIINCLPVSTSEHRQRLHRVLRVLSVQTGQLAWS